MSLDIFYVLSILLRVFQGDSKINDEYFAWNPGLIIVEIVLSTTNFPDFFLHGLFHIVGLLYGLIGVLFVWLD